MNFREGFFDKDAGGRGGRIIDAILVEATGPHIFSGFDPDKKREIDKRKAIVEKCKAVFFALDPFAVVYGSERINPIVDKIKTISLDKTVRIFYEKELFRTFRQAAGK